MQTTDFLSMSHRFEKLYTQTLTKVAEPNSLTMVELNVLLFLYNNPGYDTARDIVNLRHMAKSHVSKAVDLLSRKDFIQVIPDEHDRRKAHLKLSDSALPVAQEARRVQEELFHKLLTGITPSERTVMEIAVLKIIANIDSELKEGVSAANAFTKERTGKL